MRNPVRSRLSPEAVHEFLYDQSSDGFLYISLPWLAREYGAYYAVFATTVRRLRRAGLIEPVQCQDAIRGLFIIGKPSSQA